MHMQVSNAAGGPSDAVMGIGVTSPQKEQQQLPQVDTFAGLVEPQPPESKRMRLDTAHVEFEAAAETAAAVSNAAALYTTAQELGLAVTPEERPNDGDGAADAFAAGNEAADLSGLLAGTKQLSSADAGASTASPSDQSKITGGQSEMPPASSASVQNYMNTMMDLEGGAQMQLPDDNPLEQFGVGLLPPSSVSAASVPTPLLPSEDAAAIGAIATSPQATQQSGQEASASSSGAAHTSDPLKALSQLLNTLHMPRSCAAARQRTLPAADAGLELHDVFALFPLFLWHMLRKRLNEQPVAPEMSTAGAGGSGSGGGGAPLSQRPASPCASLFDQVASTCDLNQQPVALLVAMNVRQQVQSYLLQLMEALQPLCLETPNSGGSANAPVPRIVTDRLPHAIPTFATGVLRIGNSSPPVAAAASGSASISGGIGALSLEFLEQLPQQTRTIFLQVCFSRAIAVITKVNQQAPNSPQFPIALTPEFIETLSNLSFSSDLNSTLLTYCLICRY